MAQHTITFDTFQYATDLKKAGFTEIQIETQIKYAREQTKSISALIDDSLATKQDIKELDLKIETVRTEIKLSEERTNKNIAQMGYKTIIGLGSLITGGVAILGFLIKL
jgi:hypothetical protein